MYNGAAACCCDSSSEHESLPSIRQAGPSTPIMGHHKLLAACLLLLVAHGGMASEFVCIIVHCIGTATTFKPAAAELSADVQRAPYPVFALSLPECMLCLHHHRPNIAASVPS